MDAFYLAAADGSDAVKVADIPATGNTQAAWAPDSRRMALIYDIDGFPSLRIVAPDRPGGGIVGLGDLRPLDVAWGPPTGDRLLIRAQNPAGRVDLYTLQPDGSDLHPFGLMRDAIASFGPEYLTGITWSPDGRTIAYNGLDPAAVSSPGGPQHFRLHLVAADGSNDRAVPGPADPEVQENWPVYSPDGRSIAVVHWQFTNGVPGTKQSLAILPADGSAPAREIGPRFDDTTRDAAIKKTWSPDGTRILMSGVGTTEQVFSIDPVTGTYELIPWTTVLPDWQRTAP
jgi:Tol biopolymer transport system component